MAHKVPNGSPTQQTSFKAQFWAYAPTFGDLVLYVTGNCKELGNWNPDHAHPLEKNVDGDQVTIPYKDPVVGDDWSGQIIINTLKPEQLQYRYFIGRKHDLHNGHAVFVKRLEGHSVPRQYTSATGDMELDQPDLFGVIDGEESHIPGYLTDHTCIVFVFDPAGVEWTSQNYHQRQIRVKFEHAEPVRYLPRKRPEYRVARFLGDPQCHQFCKQSTHGPLVNSQPMMFRCDMHLLEICHVRVDFFDVGREKAAVPPKYFAYALVSGTLLNFSHGKVKVPIRMPVQQSVKYVTDCGNLTLHYTVVKPLPRHQSSFYGTVHRPWQLSLHADAPVLHIGHRGCGSSYYLDECSNRPNLCENSLASFARAAEVGADFLEMDVMFDVDLTPIIYHDHTVLVLGKDCCLTEVAVKDLTLQMLRSDKVYHITETDGIHRFPKTGPESPFPSLEQALNSMDPEVGFHLEIKYPVQMIDGKSELNPIASTSYREEYKELRFPFFNKDVYVDGILHITMSCAGNREIFFSSYDLDICAMLRLKQLRYPVFLVTSNDDRKGLLYENMLINYLKRAIYSARAFELEGVIVPTGVLFQHSWFIPLVTSLKLKVIVYGKVNNSVESINDLKCYGIVKGIIYDRIQELICDTKENYEPRGPMKKCVEGRQYCLGYTGFIPGRQNLVGTDSMVKNTEKKDCSRFCLAART